MNYTNKHEISFLIILGHKPQGPDFVPSNTRRVYKFPFGWYHMFEGRNVDIFKDLYMIF